MIGGVLILAATGLWIYGVKVQQDASFVLRDSAFAENLKLAAKVSFVVGVVVYSFGQLRAWWARD